MILAAGFEKTICSTALVLWKIYADYVWFWENLVLSNTGFEGKKTYAAQHLLWKKYYDRQTWFSEKNIMLYRPGFKKSFISTALVLRKHYALQRRF